MCERTHLCIRVAGPREGQREVLAPVVAKPERECTPVLAQLDPVKGNVGFASAAAGWSFTLQSYARLYVDVYGSAFDPREFARRLWGDVWFHPDTRTFRRKAPQGVADVQRSFVQFVLEPLYKIYSQVWDPENPL